MIDEKKIDEVTDKLVETYYPREIYLFGSYAWGKPSEESDLDLLIVVDELEQEPWKAQSLGYKVLFNFDFPKDIVVYSQKEFEERSKNVSSLFYKIKKEGKRLYARA